MSIEKDTYLNRFLSYMSPTTNTVVNGVAPAFNSPEQTLDTQISPQEASKDLEQFAAMVNEQVAGSNKNAKLAAFRARMPFVEIMPLPDIAYVVTALASAPKDITIPDGAKLMRITALAGFCSFTTNGANPYNTMGPTDVLNTITVAVPIHRNERYYIDGLNSISLSPTADSTVFIEFWVQI